MPCAHSYQVGVSSGAAHASSAADAPIRRVPSQSSMDVMAYLGLGGPESNLGGVPIGELQDMASMAHAHALQHRTIHNQPAGGLQHHQQSSQQMGPDGMLYHHPHPHQQHGQMYSSGEMMDILHGGGTVENEMVQLDTLRLHRLAASIAPAAVAVHDVGIGGMDAAMAGDEHAYWGNDYRYEDDDAEWAHMELPHAHVVAAASIPSSPASMGHLPSGSVNSPSQQARARRTSSSEHFFG